MQAVSYGKAIPTHEQLSDVRTTRIPDELSIEVRDCKADVSEMLEISRRPLQLELLEKFEDMEISDYKARNAQKEPHMFNRQERKIFGKRSCGAGEF